MFFYEIHILNIVLYPFKDTSCLILRLLSKTEMFIIMNTTISSAGDWRPDREPSLGKADGESYGRDKFVSCFCVQQIYTFI